MVYSLGFFHPVLLFGPVCLLVFQNFPPRMFIRTRTFIRHLRVPVCFLIFEDFALQYSRVHNKRTSPINHTGWKILKNQ